MDKLNRLTKNDEWKVGMRYRSTQGKEVTFLGWQQGHATKGDHVGWPVLLCADESKMHPSPDEWRGRWSLVPPLVEPPPAQRPKTADDKAEALVSAIDFPHLRDGGQWRQEKQHGQARSFSRACHYVEQLRALGMADADIACLLSDLYWDAATEMRLKEEASPRAEAARLSPPTAALAAALGVPRGPAVPGPRLRLAVHVRPACQRALHGNRGQRQQGRTPGDGLGRWLGLEERE